MMTFDAMITELESIKKAKRILKYQSMIYQLEAKAKVAQFYGKPIESYFYIPYSEWSKLCERFLNDGGNW
jgi:hypothetical protein